MMAMTQTEVDIGCNWIQQKTGAKTADNQVIPVEKAKPQTSKAPYHITFCSSARVEEQ